MLKFTIDKNQVVLEPTQLAIPAIKKIWDSDKSTTKKRANQLLLFVYYFYDLDSPFYDLDEREKEQVCLKNSIGDKITDDESKMLEELISLYKKLNETSEKRFLAIFDKKIDDLRELLSDTKPEIISNENNQGVTIFTTNTKIITDLMKAFTELSENKQKIVDSLEKRSNNSKIRGDKQLSVLEKKQKNKQKAILVGNG